MPTTAVISPRGHESSWSRTMIQARMSGAAAAASSSQCRIGWTVQPVSDPVAPSMLAFGLSGLVLYQGKNRLSASSRPPSTARYSPRPRRARFMRRGAYTVSPRERRAGGGTGRAAALLVGRLGAGIRRVPRPRMGPAGARAPRAVREALPRGVPVRAVLDHDPAQARGLSRRVRGL